MKLNFLYQFLIFFWNAKKIFTKPKKSEVLIYDRCNSEVLGEYIDLDKVQILDIRGESINLYVLFCTIIKLGVKNIRGCYAQMYAKIVKAKVVITFIDNSFSFYFLKNNNPNLKTIFVQNGLRAIAGDIFLKLETKKYKKEKYEVDLMLCFGQAIAKKYKKYIIGNSVVIGSFKNNMIKKLNSGNNNNILFISQFRQFQKKPMFLTYDKQEPVFWESFYSAEKFLLPLLYSFCIQNKFRLQICGAYSYEDQLNNELANIINKEKNFYYSIIGNSDWDFFPRQGTYSSYKKIDECNYVVSIDSTLGYESLARRNKTAIFSIRSFEGIEDDKIGLNFGWPKETSKVGPFWTCYRRKDDFFKIMNNLKNINNDDWFNSYKKYIEELMIFDQGNNKFLNLMKEYGIPLKKI